ncbi:MAG: PDZ domain-containing protein [Actinomycetota bacterium]|nr:PDZ domain-containing protein [Actinomycetota bacterium]
MRHPFRIASFVVVATVLVAAAWIRLPYYAIGPGPARSVTPQVRYDDRPRYDPTGALEMTTVSYHQVSPLQAIAVWLEPDWALIPQADLYPTGNVALENQRSISEMDQSKIDATWVVLRRLTTYPREHGRGALVESTVPDCSADGRLFPGDIITAIDGHPVRDTADVSRLLHDAKQGQALSFRLDVDGKVEHATFARKPCGPDKELLVGFRSIDAFPFPVSIDSGEIGGPSAGLMWSLGLYELMTPGDLTGGRTIAGTGTIDLRGNVGPIGGITDKVVAAEHAGATIFLAPADDMAELDGVDTGAMKVISVATFADALRALRPGETTT